MAGIVPGRQRDQCAWGCLPASQTSRGKRGSTSARHNRDARKDGGVDGSKVTQTAFSHGASCSTVQPLDRNAIWRLARCGVAKAASETKKIKRSRRRRPVPCRYFNRDPLSVLLAGEAEACVLYICATEDSPGGRLAERESPGATKNEPAAVRGRCRVPPKTCRQKMRRSAAPPSACDRPSTRISGDNTWRASSESPISPPAVRLPPKKSNRIKRNLEELPRVREVRHRNRARSENETHR